MSKYQCRLRARHREISAFGLGLSQQIAFAEPSKRACEGASPHPGHNRPTWVVMNHTPRAFAGDRLRTSQRVSCRLCCLPPFFMPRFCQERLCCPRKLVSSQLAPWTQHTLYKAPLHSTRRVVVCPTSLSLLVAPKRLRHSGIVMLDVASQHHMWVLFVPKPSLN